MFDIVVSSTEFQNQVGRYIEHAGTVPVLITRHGRPARVLLDIKAYERMKATDTRRAYFAWEMPSATIAALEAARFDHVDPALDDLLD